MNDNKVADIEKVEIDIANTELAIDKMKEVLALPKTSVAEIEPIGVAIMTLREKWVDLRWKLFFLNHDIEIKKNK